MTDDRPLVLAVVNDFPFATAGVAALLRPYGHRVKVEQFVGALPPRGGCDVVLLDVFGRPDPAALLGQAIGETGAAVLLFSCAESQEQIDEAVGRGAAGFVSKTADREEILAAVEAAAGIPVRAMPSAEGEVNGAWPGQYKGLTPRESEVVSLIVSGLSNKDIAGHIFLSINSIKSYIRSAYRKMGVTSRSQAVLWGLEHGFRVEHRQSWHTSHTTQAAAPCRGGCQGST